MKALNLKYFQAYQKAIKNRNLIFDDNATRLQSLDYNNGANKFKKYSAYANVQQAKTSSPAKRLNCILSLRGPDLYVECQ